MNKNNNKTFTYSTETMSKMYDVNKLPEGTFTLQLKVIDHN